MGNSHILAIIIPVLLGFTYFESAHSIDLLRKSAQQFTMDPAQRYANQLDTDTVTSAEEDIYVAREMGKEAMELAKVMEEMTRQES